MKKKTTARRRWEITPSDEELALLTEDIAILQVVSTALVGLQKAMLDFFLRKFQNGERNISQEDVITEYRTKLKKLYGREYKEKSTSQSRKKVRENWQGPIFEVNAKLERNDGTAIFFIGRKFFEDEPYWRLVKDLEVISKVAREQSVDKGSERSENLFIDFNWSMETIETRFIDLIEKDDSISSESIFQSLNVRIKDAIENIDNLVKQTGYINYWELIDLGNEPEKELIKVTHSFRRYCSIFVLLTFIIVNNEYEALYSIICGVLKDIFENLNSKCHRVYHDCIIFISSCLICSFALKLKRFIFMILLFDIEGVYEYEIKDYDGRSGVNAHFVMKDSVIGLINYDLLVVKNLGSNYISNNYWSIFQRTQLERFIYNHKLLYNYFDPHGDGIKYILFYDHLVMFRFFRDNKLNKINYNEPYCAHTIMIDYETDKGAFRRKLMKEIEREFIKNFYYYNKMLRLPSLTVLKGLISPVKLPIGHIFPEYLNLIEKSKPGKK